VLDRQLLVQVGRVERGLYVVGDNSWSIDMQRYNFQFTAQRFVEIRDGELRGPLLGCGHIGAEAERLRPKSTAPKAVKKRLSLWEGLAFFGFC